LARKQLTLFGGTKAVPEGFKYQPEILSAEKEQSILERVRSLPFKEFEFQGFVGKRRTVSYGWRYDFNDRSLQKADDIPDFLLSLREVAGEFAELPPSALQQVLVTEYDAGAAIGWHRDKKVFGDVVGISLLSACRFRFRRKSGSSWERAAIVAEPRSAYLLRGPSRTEWEHSIPGVEALRYSITYRSLRESGEP
jgi:alkylated DNA repair dioxygenase AlkB